MKTINTLIVEDHPLMVQNYLDSIAIFQEENQLKYLFNCTNVSNCSEAYETIINFKTNETPIDLVILDISIPGDSNINMLSGEDIGRFIKEQFPDSKIIVSTSLDDNYRISSLMSRIMPMSVLVKTELTIDEIINTLKDVLNNKKSYSPRISKIIDNLTNSDHNHIDETDRRIIYEISMGSRIADMVEILSVSKATIENRKKRIKEILDCETDRELIVAAKQKGFI